MATYKHAQAGKFSRVTFGALILIFLFPALWRGANDPAAIWIFSLLAALMLVGLLLFHALTVEVARGYVRLRFGIGVIRKRFRVRDIEAAETVRNRWWYGWGIKLTPHGWLFSVSGFDAVQIRLKNGRQYRIGTDEPDRLLAAIEAAMRYS